MTAAAPTPEHTAKECKFCRGHGNIWVNWHPTPVTCGHCGGTGKAPDFTVAGGVS